MLNQKTGLSLGWLLLAVAYFCHRYYGVYFPLEGDTLQNLYFRLHEDLLRADHNPYQWYYASWMPYHGGYNPLIQLLTMGVGWFPIEPMARAVVVNMLASGLSLYLLSVGVFFFLRQFQRSHTAALLGATLVSFTGFHLVGVREFNQMYLLSFASVPWVVLSFYQMRHSRLSVRLKWTGIASLAIGFSLLGGSNAPLFYYLPLAFFLPWIGTGGEKGQWKECVKQTGFQLVSVLWGMAVAAVVLLEGFASLGETNRRSLSFTEGAPVTGLGEKIRTLFFRDWWRSEGWHPHEVDYFLGVPVLLLLVLGLSQFQRRNSMDRWCLLGLGVAGVITCQPLLPTFLGAPIAYFFESLSIRFPDRFFMLALLPIAFFASRGFDALKQKLFFMALAGVGSVAVALGWFWLPITWTKLMPDSQWAAGISLTFMWIAVCSLLGLALFRQRYYRWGTLAAIYLMYCFASPQATGYPNEFAGQPARQATLPKDRLSLKNQLGLAWRYDDFIEGTRRLFFKPAPYLTEAMTQGKILFEPNFNTLARYHFHAPQTQHKFAFTYVFDPASPARLRQLAYKSTKAMYDMQGICWLVLTQNRMQPEIVQRESCLPPAYYIPKEIVHNDETEILEWLTQANTETLKTTLARQRSEGPGRTIAFEAGAPNRNVELVSSTPGKYEFQIGEGQGGALFLSTVYRPEWKAQFQGKPLRPFRANYAYMAIPLGSGVGKLELVFEPILRKWGLFITLLTSILAIVGTLYLSFSRVDLGDSGF